MLSLDCSFVLDPVHNTCLFSRSCHGTYNVIMRASSVLLGLLSATAALAAPSSSIEVVERMRSVPDGWTQLDAPSPNHLLRFRLAVKQERAAEFEQLVIDIATPGHESYGKHMSKTELKTFLKPRAEVSQTIFEWLDAEGVSVDAIEDDGDWVNFIVPVSQAEKMMHTKFYYYYNYQTKKNSIRTLEYSLPADVAEVVQMIQPTTRFGQPKAQGSQVFDVVFDSSVEALTIPTTYDPTFCNSSITPVCLRGLYNMGNFTANGDVGNKIGISGYLEEYARYDDTEAFIEQLFPVAEGWNFSWTSISGGLMDQNSDSDFVEANLDVQYALAMSFNTSMDYYSTAGRGILVPDLDQPTAADDENEPYLDQLHYLLSLPDDELPTVLSTSYGEDEQSVPADYTNATCSLFAQLGARGVSVLFSSGDTGVGSACQTNDGLNTTRFLPIFPAACPFVTSVGGTYKVEPERAVSFSSGGFSDRFARPSYQDDAVSAYLEILGDRWEGLYNPAGRGFPDVAAQGYNFLVEVSGSLSYVAGTR